MMLVESQSSFLRARKSLDIGGPGQFVGLARSAPDRIFRDEREKKGRRLAQRVRAGTVGAHPSLTAMADGPRRGPMKQDNDASGNVVVSVG